jgi:excisionase family DNA binding protein
MDLSQKKVLTFQEGCELLGFKKSYVYKLVHYGILPFSKPNNGRVFFDREKLEAWMLSNASTSQNEKQIQAATYVTTHK